eukprot:CAMPEP_0182423320 /NCGR_PEP_ID=MMETSP1167-20130531/9274_1 /TAXON_ID=2988 /ORGANISM="Mallomonas Sp, Strain CCMP3275" /LENGTH=343 /DNA_ID=CAMNT_0024602171 /DNA_START=261 /DNA_END=1292 /DNA_ORIENTATION=+
MPMYGSQPQQEYDPFAIEDNDMDWEGPNGNAYYAQPEPPIQPPSPPVPPPPSLPPPPPSPPQSSFPSFPNNTETITPDDFLSPAIPKARPKKKSRFSDRDDLSHLTHPISSSLSPSLSSFLSPSFSTSTPPLSQDPKLTAQTALEAAFSLSSGNQRPLSSLPSTISSSLSQSYSESYNTNPLSLSLSNNTNNLYDNPMDEQYNDYNDDYRENENPTERERERERERKEEKRIKRKVHGTVSSEEEKALWKCCWSYARKFLKPYLHKGNISSREDYEILGKKMAQKVYEKEQQRGTRELSTSGASRIKKYITEYFDKHDYYQHQQGEGGGGAEKEGSFILQLEE